MNELSLLLSLLTLLTVFSMSLRENFGFRLHHI